MFKVWVHVEHEKDGDYEEYSGPVCLGEFSRARQAEDFVDKLETVQPDKQVKKKRKPDYAP